MFLLSLCFGSQLADQVCQQSYEKFKEQTPGFEQQLKIYQRKYVDTLPVELIWTGTVANLVYKKQLKFGIYKGTYLDLRDEGQFLIGYKLSFP